MTKYIEQLYLLKSHAVEHIKSHRYHSASVYLQDTLQKFKLLLEQPIEEKDLERVITDIQISSHKNLSLCYLKLNKYAQSVEECKFVLQLEPNNIKMIYRIGKAHLQLKHFKQAQQYFKRGFHLDPHQKQIMKQLQELQKNKAIKSIKDNNKSQILNKLKNLMIFLIMLIPLFTMRVAEKTINLLGLQSYNENRTKRQ